MSASRAINYAKVHSHRLPPNESNGRIHEKKMNKMAVLWPERVFLQTKFQRENSTNSRGALEINKQMNTTQLLQFLLDCCWEQTKTRHNRRPKKNNSIFQDDFFYLWCYGYECTHTYIYSVIGVLQVFTCIYTERQTRIPVEQKKSNLFGLAWVRRTQTHIIYSVFTTWKVPKVIIPFSVK